MSVSVTSCSLWLLPRTTYPSVTEAPHRLAQIRRGIAEKHRSAEDPEHAIDSASSLPILWYTRPSPRRCSTLGRATPVMSPPQFSFTGAAPVKTRRPIWSNRSRALDLNPAAVIYLLNRTGIGE